LNKSIGGRYVRRVEKEIKRKAIIFRTFGEEPKTKKRIQESISIYRQEEEDN